MSFAFSFVTVNWNFAVGGFGMGDDGDETVINGFVMEVEETKLGAKFRRKCDSMRVEDGVSGLLGSGFSLSDAEEAESFRAFVHDGSLRAGFSLRRCGRMEDLSDREGVSDDSDNLIVECMGDCRMAKGSGDYRSGAGCFHAFGKFESSSACGPAGLDCEPYLGVPNDLLMSSYVEKSLLGHGSLAELEKGNGDRDVQLISEALMPTCWNTTELIGINKIQHKRAKFLEQSQTCHYAAAAGTGASASSDNADHSVVSQGVSVPSGNDMPLYLSPTPNDGDGRKSMDSNGGGGDDGDECCDSKTEDQVVRMDLTDDLLHMVFSFLDHVNLCRAARVCRQWRAASSHEDFWMHLNFENRNISPQQFSEMCHRYPNATEVNILGVPAVDILVWKAMTSLRNIEVLVLGKGQLGDAFFQALSDCPALNSLTISDASLGNGIQDIPVYHESLRHLHILRCRVIRISVRCPQLETLSLRRTGMAHTILNCPQLRELDVGSCHKLSDAGIRSAATSCPLLSSLDMSNCSCVSDETLREIALACLNLRVLDASYCNNISLESVRLPMLTNLKLLNCDGITSASMAAISYCFMLEALHLDSCMLLTSVTLDLPHLESIRLVHCRKFVDLNLRCPVLSSVTVSNCSILNRVSISSNSLRKLVLQKQESLTTVSLQCPRLQEVDLTECESLTNSICEVFCDGGGCPMLTSLVLDSCESLTRVKLNSTSLVSLSLVACRAMTSLELACPNLQQVFLDSCDHLEEASFFPVGLRSLNLGICPKLNILQIQAPLMTVLELKGCGVLSQASISCPRLMSLDASFCSQLADDCLSVTTALCPFIESLILMSCPLVGPDGLSSLRRLQCLTLLDLSYTFLMNLQPIFETCLQLKVLKLQACKYLTNSSLDPLHKGGALPALRELDLSYGSICQSAIEELLACCTHLTHVSMNGCVNMHDLNWGSVGSGHIDLSTSDNPSGPFLPLEIDHDLMDKPDRLLQNLNCVGCPNIKKVIIPPSARCVHLSSLNLSLSVNLKEVDLACFNLHFLNLSNCFSLETLKLECPRLTSLFLQTCGIEEEVVQAAISHCYLLETLDIRFCMKISVVGIGRCRAVCPSLKRIFSSLSV